MKELGVSIQGVTQDPAEEAKRDVMVMVEEGRVWRPIVTYEREGGMLTVGVAVQPVFEGNALSSLAPPQTSWCSLLFSMTRGGLWDGGSSLFGSPAKAAHSIIMWGSVCIRWL